MAEINGQEEPKIANNFTIIQITRPNTDDIKMNWGGKVKEKRILMSRQDDIKQLVSNHKRRLQKL